MKATDWEFRNRASLFGLIFAFTFLLYSLDHQNSTAALANWLGARFGIPADLLGRLLFALAALFVVAAALIRTWASSYLNSEVVYAAEVKSESLVADGPYRRVRNPLYLGNVLMAAGIGAMMSRIGFFVAVVAMLAFCYRLIIREEAELQASQGEQYERYRRAVRRLLPSLRPCASSGGRPAKWIEGFKAESWIWGFAAAVVAFAITLKLVVFYVILAPSIVALWAFSVFLQNKSDSRGEDNGRRS